jgi:hypothetical protein
LKDTHHFVPSTYTNSLNRHKTIPSKLLFSHFQLRVFDDNHSRVPRVKGKATHPAGTNTLDCDLPTFSIT